MADNDAAGSAAWDFVSATDGSETLASPDGTPIDLRTDIPHVARIYDYWLGGKTNYEADRKVAQSVMDAMPAVSESVQANRGFLRRAVHLLVSEYGVRQILDVGSGLPTIENTHEVAQRVAPETRVVYVDNDPIVLVHAQALLTSSPEGVTDYLHGDVRNPADILARAATTLDFTRPIALILSTVMHCLEDSEDPWALTRALSDGLPDGSFLVFSHIAVPQDVVLPSSTEQSQASDAYKRHNAGIPGRITPRSRADIERFFVGWELIEPGLVPASSWRGDDPKRTVVLAGVARRP